MARKSRFQQPQPTLTAATFTSSLETELGFRTPAGEWVPRATGETALHNGHALLIGGLLIGLFPS